MFNPVATYRLQFHKEFTFTDFERIIPYLQKLGVSTVYASPIFEAVPGSTHGYDSVNPHKINTEIGNLKQLKLISKKLKDQGISWLQDIVPNHMAYHPNNAWLMDVLEKGPLSVYKHFFDLIPSADPQQGRIMVPFLGSSLEDTIEKGELKVAYEKQKLVFSYYDSAWPLNLQSYETILSSGPDKPNEAIQQLLAQIRQILEIENPKALFLAMDELRMQLASLVKDAASKKYLTACLQTINSNKQVLRQIAGRQLYRLSHWQETDEQINFRRFFTVNGLICLNIQDEAVFEHFHKLIKSLLKEGVFQGLRIDHIDGLYDPTQYLAQLRELTGDETYIAVEKILEQNEGLPEKWPVQGNTGYDFLADVNNLFTLKSSERSFRQFYNTLINNSTAVHLQVLEKKIYILYQHMGGELENLFRLFLKLNLADEKTLTSIPPNDLKQAIGEFLVHFPVYRYYGNQFPLDSEEAAAIQNIFTNIRKVKPDLQPAIKLLETVLLKNPLQRDKEYNGRALRFYQRCMQFTGPLMAKGVEDTLMYTYNRFAGRNEVGDSPEAFDLSIAEFHQKMNIRQDKWSLSMNATSTHDTKRGEDVRARLNVLTDMAAEWMQTVTRWQQLNQGLKQNNAPDANDEYFIYQTLIGAYPMPGEDEDDFSVRIQEYIEKALREAKQHSNWTTPNEEYENAAKTFALGLLDKKNPFWQSFQKLHHKIADHGIVNSLSQLTLKFTCPGVPDVYQGCELWDLSLVDPDNRRPVDYELRQQWLEELQLNTNGPEKLVGDLWEDRYNAKIKLWLLLTLLNERKQHAELFEKGDYIPLEIKGRYKGHVFAFARRYRQTWYVVAVPLHLAELCRRQKKDILTIDWKNTRIMLPPEAPEHWENLLLKIKGKQENEILVNDIFKGLPLAVLKLQQPENNRGAGVLMHITSLPSAFGVGDFGPEAKIFANFLNRSHQKYWQLLPLSPTELVNGHSPYSSYSSLAGNTLLISPELLVDDGLLDRGELPQYYLPKKNKADYQQAEQVKDQLFEKAWNNFKNGDHPILQKQFDKFCLRESSWLSYFALYVTLKQHHEGTPWFLWPEKYKLRHRETLDEFAAINEDALNKARWLQYIFSKQWNGLKTYCNNQGIQLFGDLPFYVSYDSVDVWAYPELFSTDENGNMKGIAGVPPDYFNANGQLWGMPVFCWDKLKECRYDWWVQRIRKNMELYDLLRLDHFRAFSAYWEVPAGEETAINGKWVAGPGIDFFKVLQKELGELPFVAEDLGDIDDAVHQLREECKLPGMKVLQFAFGDNMPASAYIPHNHTADYIAYTGTHDNNTTRGWYKQDADQSIRKQIEQYTGIHVREKNIHLVLSRLAYSSVARTVILPVQDVLGLDESARINMPASTANNWLWRLLPGQLHPAHEKRLKEWVKLYNRA